MNDHDVPANIRLSIARHGTAGWRWTMLLTTEEDDFAVGAEFRTGEDGRGTWMRLIGEPDEAWTLVSPPAQRVYSPDAETARAEIEQVCVAAATDLVRAHRLVRVADHRVADHRGGGLETMQTVGSC